MPKVNWDDVDEGGGGGYNPVPCDEYLCKVTKAEEVQSKAGNIYWSITFRIEQGVYAGYLVLETIHFTENAKPRAKYFLSRLGLDVSGTKQEEPSKIVGKVIWVTTEHEEYNNQKRSKPSYYGFRAIGGGDGDEAIASPSSTNPKDDLPF